MAPAQVPRWSLGALSVIAVTFGCTDRAAVTAQRPGIHAIVEPIYDEDGQPQSTYYSANSQVTWTADSAFEPAGASFTHSYFEEYTWAPSYQTWDHASSYGTGDLPFGTSYPPEIDVASARMLFGGASAPEIRERSGAALQPSTTRPSLQSDTIPMSPITLPSGAPPGSPTFSLTAVAGARLAGPAGSAGEPSPRLDGPARRGAGLERLIVTPQTRVRVLERLRASFAESRIGAGLRFTKRVGSTEVAVMFDPAAGAITEMATRDDGRLVSRTTYRYVPEPRVGGFVLAEVVTQVFGRDGSAGRTFRQTYRNLTAR